MNKFLLAFAVLAVLKAKVKSEQGILYPRSTVTRETQSLDGLWKFSLSPNEHEQDSQDTDIELMPVPSSYNDISTNSRIRDYVGIVKYQRSFVVPKSWQDKIVWLRFGSVCYAAKVYINGELAMSHEIGHLPFVGQINKFLNFDDDNDIIVLVDNTLTESTLPQGSNVVLPSGRLKQQYEFDYFNYAGIDRPVLLYTTEKVYIDDITVNSTLNGTSALVKYNISLEGNDAENVLKVSVRNKEGKVIESNDDQNFNGVIEIPNVKLWWPYLMNDEPGYLYTLRVEVFDANLDLLDRYDQPFGVRELTWDNTTFKINGKPIYLRGFGRHEDSDIRGKGLDLSLIVRDHNLIKWIGANSYRTSHYPYAEEIMDLADSMGIMIISECPAVSTDKFNDDLLLNHKKSVTEMIKRDKNRPSIIMWSAANEPKSEKNESEAYFKEVVAHLKTLDTSRPVTISNYVDAIPDHSAQFLDILCFNKYNGWYIDAGDLDVVVSTVIDQAEAWHQKHNKPVIMTEYGSDTLEGLHLLPSFVWTEEYQAELMDRHFQAFDELRNKGWFIGEMIWNFADFKTPQFFIRLGGNKKGLFTRQRQPKASAHLMRKRYWALAEVLDNVTQPNDVDNYIVNKY